MGGVFREERDPRHGNRLDLARVNELKGGAKPAAHLLEYDSILSPRGRRRGGRGRPRPEFGADVRAFPVRPFIIFFRIRDDDKDVEVLRIIYRRRDLGTIFAENI